MGCKVKMDFEGIYLDYNATTPMKPAVRDAMLETMGFPGNASSVHRAGKMAAQKIEESRAKIATALNACSKTVIVFTSGATEANNAVLRGTSCERILVSAIEHPSVLKAADRKEIIPVLPNGMIDLAALDQMLSGTDCATLVSIMWVNNETGVIQPLQEVVKIAKKHSVLVHTDAVQALGKIPMDIQALGADYLTFSPHKIGGPQGVGFLVMANCAPVAAQMVGGAQENFMRAGTSNLAGIVGCGEAVKQAVHDLEKLQKNRNLRDKLETELKKIAPEIIIYGSDVPRVATTSMFSVSGLSSETQLIGLDMAGICVSSGSACNSGTVKPSHVLQAMGVDETEAMSSLRVSLGWSTVEKDIDLFVDEWAKLYLRMKENRACQK